MEEKSVAVIIDIKNLSPQQFEQYRAALQRIVKEQLAHIAKFNLIRLVFVCDQAPFL
jgi:ribosomal protein L10